MHDIRLIRADPEGFDAALARRGLPPAAEAILRAMRRAARHREDAGGTGPSK